MTQEPEAISQAIPPPRVTPPFTVIIETAEQLSSTGSGKFTGTLGNGKPTHFFNLMANGTFLKSMKRREKASDISFEETGIVMLAIQKLKDDGKTPGDMVFAWERKGSGQASHQTTELETAMISDIFARFRTCMGNPQPAQKPQPAEENAQPAPVL